MVLFNPRKENIFSIEKGIIKQFRKLSRHIKPFASLIILKTNIFQFKQPTESLLDEQFNHGKTTPIQSLLNGETTSIQNHLNGDTTPI